MGFHYYFRLLLMRKEIKPTMESVAVVGSGMVGMSGIVREMLDNLAMGFDTMCPWSLLRMADS